MRYLLLILLLQCVALPGFSQEPLADKYALSIKASNLYSNVEALTAPTMNGRRIGSPGSVAAQEFLIQEFEKIGLQKPFYLGYKHTFFTSVNGTSIMGLIDGTDRKDEVVVVMAHYDFLGEVKGVVYPGAEDNASGVSALLEIAKAFAQARDEGHAPSRSILFALFDGNKDELAGAEYYLEYPLFALNKTVIALNMDMMGRVDGYAEGENDYLFVLGTDRLCTNLRKLTDSINNASIQLTVDYSFYNNNKMLFDLFYPTSEHAAFEKKHVPSLLYTSGLTSDLHSPNDTIDKLYFPTLMRRARLVFQTAWLFAMNGKWPQLKNPNMRRR